MNRTSEKDLSRILIAGTGSGVGKTSVTLALVRALARRGVKVQPYKVGPDYLDPTYLTLAAGRTCYNLDTWMCGRDYVRRLLGRTSRDCDVVVIEGAMGLFDGADVASNAGSAAEIAELLGASVVLVCDARGQARSFAATVKGFAELDPAVSLGGVIANQCGSERHVELLRQALEVCDLPPLLGGLDKGAMPSLKSRHLGLVSATQTATMEQKLEAMADALEARLSVEVLLKVSRGGVPSSPRMRGSRHRQEDSRLRGNDAQKSEILKDQVKRGRTPPRLRLGLAKDAAFHFYYQDNIEAFERCGFDLVPFSPIKDSGLPTNLDALYIGGGYPELCARDLSKNRSMSAAILDFSRSGRPLYAECGGLMYLSEGIVTLDGIQHPMVGVMPGSCRMLERIKTLGYAEVTLKQDSIWGPKGAQLRGHEFHYSEMIDPGGPGPQWETAYDVSFRRIENPVPEGYQSGNLLLSYVHLHLASNLACIEHFAEQCKRARA